MSVIVMCHFLACEPFQRYPLRDTPGTYLLFFNIHNVTISYKSIANILRRSWGALYRTGKSKVHIIQSIVKFKNIQLSSVWSCPNFPKSSHYLLSLSNLTSLLFPGKLNSCWKILLVVWYVNKHSLLNKRAWKWSCNLDQRKYINTVILHPIFLEYNTLIASRLVFFFRKNREMKIVNTVNE